jgi:hypothetical protein
MCYAGDFAMRSAGRDRGSRWIRTPSPRSRSVDAAARGAWISLSARCGTRGSPAVRCSHMKDRSWSQALVKCLTKKATRWITCDGDADHQAGHRERRVDAIARVARDEQARSLARAPRLRFPCSARSVSALPHDTKGHGRAAAQHAISARVQGPSSAQARGRTSRAPFC